MKRKEYRPRTEGQKVLWGALRTSELTVAIGPAGCGKTLAAVAAALKLLNQGEVERIVMTRAAVEAAGERLGFLPGDASEKIDPYMRPMLDAAKEMVGADEVKKMLADGRLEAAPLAFLRGRTFKDTFVIADEAQNMNRSQVRLLLTRLGEGARCAVLADPEQTDLPRHLTGGDTLADDLDPVEGVRVVFLDATDVVRSPLVARLVLRYAELDQEAVSP